MTRLATALVLLAGGLTAAVTGEHSDVSTVAPTPLTSGRHRPAPPLRVSRSMRRLPLPRGVHPGSKPGGKARSRPGSHDLRYGARQLLTITAYCYTGTRNAAGKWPTVGTAAGNAWPLGTRLDIQDVGVVVIEDRSAPGATDVDLYLGGDTGCEQRAVAWGRRQLYVREVAA